MQGGNRRSLAAQMAGLDEESDEGRRMRILTRVSQGFRVLGVGHQGFGRCAELSAGLR